VEHDVHVVRSQASDQHLERERMIEAIRTFFGKVRGERGERKTIVNQGLVYRCTKCNLLFLTKTAGEQHDCRERL
jgi:hypothetical protein